MNFGTFKKNGKRDYKALRLRGSALSPPIFQKFKNLIKIGELVERG